jgi:hypothetical protein
LPNVVIAGGGNAGVEAVVISGAEAAEALVPGLLSRPTAAVATSCGAGQAHCPIQTVSAHGV